MKCETHFSREAIENSCGKILKENSIIGKSWRSEKLFIVKNYIENAYGDVPLKNMIFLVSLSSMCANVLSL